MYSSLFAKAKVGKGKKSFSDVCLLLLYRRSGDKIYALTNIHPEMCGGRKKKNWTDECVFFCCLGRAGRELLDFGGREERHGEEGKQSLTGYATF